MWHPTTFRPWGRKFQKLQAFLWCWAKSNTLPWNRPFNWDWEQEAYRNFPSWKWATKNFRWINMCWWCVYLDCLSEMVCVPRTPVIFCSLSSLRRFVSIWTLRFRMAGLEHRAWSCNSSIKHAKSFLALRLTMCEGLQLINTYKKIIENTCLDSWLYCSLHLICHAMVQCLQSRFMLREILTLNDWNASDSTENLQVIHVFANRSSTQTVNGAIKDRWMQDISSVAMVCLVTASISLFQFCWNLTWNLNITQLKRNIIFQTSIFGFHVNLPVVYYSTNMAVLNQTQLVVFFPKEQTHIGHSIVQLQSAQNFNDLFVGERFRVCCNPWSGGS